MGLNLTVVPPTDLDWDGADLDNPGGRYLAVLVIGSQPMHLEARRVARDPDTGALTGFESHTEDFAGIAGLDPNVELQTSSAAGLGIDDPDASGEYLLFAYPHSK